MLEGLGITHLVKGVDAQIRYTRVMQKREREDALKSLKKLPSLTYLHMRIPYCVYYSFRDALSELLEDRCSRSRRSRRLDLWLWNEKPK
jgi:hypothetical protein